MKKTTFTLTFILLLMFTCLSTFAQEWTKAQLEVWQVVEDGWTKWQANDIEGSAASIHEQYQGWNDQLPLPLSKEMVIKNTQMSIDHGDKLNYFFLNPARIVITKEAAVVDYYYSFQMTTVQESGENKTIYHHGQNVEFYIKDGGKWLLLGDMTTIHHSED